MANQVHSHAVTQTRGWKPCLPILRTGAHSVPSFSLQGVQPQGAFPSLNSVNLYLDSLSHPWDPNQILPRLTDYLSDEIAAEAGWGLLGQGLCPYLPSIKAALPTTPTLATPLPVLSQNGAPYLQVAPALGEMQKAHLTWIEWIEYICLPACFSHSNFFFNILLWSTLFELKRLSMGHHHNQSGLGNFQVWGKSHLELTTLKCTVWWHLEHSALHNQRHTIYSRVSSPPKRKPWRIKQALPIFLYLQPWQPSVCFLCLWICLFWTFPIQWDHAVCDLLCLTSFI